MKEFIEKLISRLEELRQTQLEELCENKDLISEMQSMRGFNVLQDAIKIVKQLAEEYNNGWIPCSERLPENNTVVLVTYITDDLGFIVYCVKYIDEEWLQPDYSEWSLDKDMVLAWQPLPTPYQPKGE